MAIGTTAAIMAGASAVGGLAQAGAARSAANAQTAAANQQLALQEQIYNQNVERFAPFLQTGGNALNALAYEMGLGPRPTFGGTAPTVTEVAGSATGTPVYNDAGALSGYTGGSGPRYQVGGQVFDTREAADAWAAANPTGGTEYGGWEMTPGNRAIMNEGLGALEASAAARGGLYSGATMQGLQRAGQEYTNRFYGNYLDRLGGMAASGQNAAGQGAAAAQNYGNAAGQAYANIGNAQAAGAIGQGNALSGGINNMLGIWQYQNMLNNFGGAT
jgi:hypothetical protein